MGVAAGVIKGVAQGCEQAGCALIGGETAEMPGMYDPNEYDLAGFAVGLVEKSAIIDGAKIVPGDVVIGLASSGPHSNGYSLVRKVVAVSGADLYEEFDAGRTLGQALIEPTRIYVKPVLALLGKIAVKGIAHITGGGLTENIPRMLPANACARLEARRWPRPAVFDWLQRHGAIEEAEMQRTFNCGIGMTLVVPRGEAGAAMDALAAPRRRGLRDRRDRGAPLWRAANGDRLTAGVKSAVILISGRGSNMRAIVEARTGLEVRAVISNRPEAAGLEWAAAQGIPTARSSTTRLRRRARRSTTRWPRRSTRHAPDLVLLAGFMRILGDAFIAALRGAHPQHPSLAAAGLPRPAHAPARARGRREAPRRHRALRHARRSTTARS